MQIVLFYVSVKFPRYVANSLKSQVDSPFQKSQTVEALKVNKFINQSEKAIRAGFRHENCTL